MPINDRIKVLLFGGGPVHDYQGICSVLQEYLEEDVRFSVELVIEDYDVFLPDRINAYDLVVLYHTSGTLTPVQVGGLTQWVASGHGIVGVHSAADSFKSNPEYIAMLGGVFRGHPAVRRFIVSLVDPVPGEESIENHMTHPITAAMEGYTKKNWEQWPIFEYEVEDEQYLLEMASSVDVLANTLFRGRACPIAWTRSWGEGRVFYLALGHDVNACRFPFFKSIFLQGSRWGGGMIQNDE